MAYQYQRLLFRYLQLNERKPKVTDGDFGELPTLQKLINTAWLGSPRIRDRHFPPLGPSGVPVKGTAYLVALKKIEIPETEAVIVRFCTFRGGESHGYAPTDLDASEADVEHKEIKDPETGRIIEPGIAFSALFLGRVILLQNRMGAGAAEWMKRFVNAIGKQVVGKKFVKPDFLQVGPKNIARQIEAAGGVASVRFNVGAPVDASGKSKKLGDIRKYETSLRADKARLSFSSSSEEPLDAEESMRLLDEGEAEGISAVSLELKDKEIIRGEEVVLSRSVKIRLVDGVMDVKHVEKELISYLFDLKRVDDHGHQQLDANGYLGNDLKLLSLSTKG